MLLPPDPVDVEVHRTITIKVLIAQQIAKTLFIATKI